MHAQVWQHTNRLDLELVGRPPFGILPLGELSTLKSGHTAANASGTAQRVVETVRDKQV